MSDSTSENTHDNLKQDEAEVPKTSDSPNREQPNDSDENPQDLEIEEEEVVIEDLEQPVGRIGIRRRVERLKNSGIRATLRRHAFPIMTAFLLIVIFITFRKILLPFIFATILVYLMEPVVRRLSTRGTSKLSKFALPRWLSVIIVYLSFLGVISLGAFWMVPKLVNEGISVVRTMPQTFKKIREEQLPQIDEKIQSYVKEYFPANSSETHFAAARARVDNARKVALLEAAKDSQINELKKEQDELIQDAPKDARGWVVRAFEAATKAVDETQNVAKDDFEKAAQPKQSGAESDVIVPPILSKEMQNLVGTTTGWYYAPKSAQSGFRMRKNRDGQLELFAADFEIEVDEVEKGRWVIRNHPQRAVDVVDHTAQIVSLQSLLDDAIDDISQFSNRRFASIIDFLRRLVVGIIGGFVAIVLTMMVAAFMSIDLPRVLGYIRTLVPGEARAGYDVLLKRIDRGVSGVIRGQLLICVINGCLTYIGLHLLEIDFALLLAVIAGVMSLIPVFGTVISTIPIVLFSLSDGVTKALLSLAWILFIHFVEANILNPKIIGKSAEIHPVLVIFALLAGESTFGIVGALLAVPVASIVLTFFEFLRTSAWRDGDIPEDDLKVDTVDAVDSLNTFSDGTDHAAPS